MDEAVGVIVEGIILLRIEGRGRDVAIEIRY